MPSPRRTEFSKRERQVMDILYRRGQSSAADVLQDLPDPPGYSTVRKILEILEAKGHVRHVRDGQRYLFAPTVPNERASQQALTRVLDVFFQGSLANAVSSLVTSADKKVDRAELERIATLARAAKSQGR